MHGPNLALEGMGSPASWQAGPLFRCPRAAPQQGSRGRGSSPLSPLGIPDLPWWAIFTVCQSRPGVPPSSSLQVSVGRPSPRSPPAPCGCAPLASGEVRAEQGLVLKGDRRRVTHPLFSYPAGIPAVAPQPCSARPWAGSRAGPTRPPDLTGRAESNASRTPCSSALRPAPPARRRRCAARARPRPRRRTRSPQPVPREPKEHPTCARWSQVRSPSWPATASPCWRSQPQNQRRN